MRFLVAHSVRVDAQDNIWIVDEGSGQVVKFAPDGRVLMILGRKPEAVSRSRSGGRRAGRRRRGRGRRAGRRRRSAARRAPAAPATSSPVRATSPGTATATSSSPTATAPMHASRSSTGTDDSSRRGDREDPTPGSSTRRIRLPSMPQGNVYVADQGNKRIQVFDRRRHVQVADHERRRPHGALHLARIPSVSLQLPHRRSLRNGRCGDVQAGARRANSR